MLIASYNKEQLGDVLLTVVAPDAAAQSCEKKGNIVRILMLNRAKRQATIFSMLLRSLAVLKLKRSSFFG